MKSREREPHTNIPAPGAGKRRRGRPKGYPKTGGRKKGSLNKATLAARQMDERDLVAYGISPVCARDFAALAPIQRINAFLAILSHV